MEEHGIFPYTIPFVCEFNVKQICIRKYQENREKRCTHSGVKRYLKLTRVKNK